MMRNRWLWSAWLGMLTACGISGSGGNGGGSLAPRENTATTLTLTGARFYSEYRNGVIGTLADGDVVLAMLLADDKGYNADLAVLRLDTSLKPRWAVRIDEKDIPSAIVQGRDGALFVLTGNTYPGILRVLRLKAEDGSVERAVELNGLTPGRALPLEDGGLLLAAGNLARVDANLAPVWAKDIAAVDAVAVKEGFIAAGISYGFKSTMTGIGLAQVSASGQVAWKSFASPGPGNHSLAGLRTQADGSLQVGLGNDSTRSDNVAFLKPLVFATFDARGGLQRMSAADLQQDVPTSTGSNTTTPLQFGSGHALVTQGEDSWVTFTANSGPIGSDVRTQVLARFGADGSFQEARYAGLHAATGPEGSVLSYSLPSSLAGDTLTLLRTFPQGTGCMKAPTRSAFTDVKGKTEYTEAASVQVSDVRVTPRAVTRTASPLSLSSAPGGCAAP